MSARKSKPASVSVTTRVVRKEALRRSRAPAWGSSATESVAECQLAIDREKASLAATQAKS
jgi:hypothetical protein